MTYKAFAQVMQIYPGSTNVATVDLDVKVVRLDQNREDTFRMYGIAPGLLAGLLESAIKTEIRAFYLAAQMPLGAWDQIQLLESLL